MNNVVKGRLYNFYTTPLVDHPEDKRALKDSQYDHSLKLKDSLMKHTWWFADVDYSSLSHSGITSLVPSKK